MEGQMGKGVGEETANQRSARTCLSPAEIRLGSAINMSLGGHSLTVDVADEIRRAFEEDPSLIEALYRTQAAKIER